MNASQYLNSKFLSAADIPEGVTVPATIEAIEEAEVGRDKEIKPILRFSGKRKALVLNATNLKKLAGIFGEEMERWIGQRIELFTAEVSFGGDAARGIRVRAVKQPAKTPPVEAANAIMQEAAATEPVSSDLPF